MAVALLDLKAQYAPIRSSVLEAITRVCDSQYFVMGPEVDGLERELADMLETRHAIGVSSGTDAILLALMALGIGTGDEVIVPTYSFFATAGCVSRVGATPVFVDIDPTTFNASPAAIAAAITPRTKAIIPVHLYGLIAEMEAICDIAAKAGIAVIEDAAQAIGARRHNRHVGSFGVAACLSFFPSKNLGAFGDGGLVTTNDSAFAAELRLLRNHGAEPKYHHAKIGGNFRLDALQAAVLRVKAPHLSAWTDARRRNADRYRALFAAAGLDSLLTLPVEPDGSFHIYNQFVIRGPRRDELRSYLTARQISTEIYYPVPFHRQQCFASIAGSNAFPEADAAASSSVAIPIYGELTAEQQREVVDAIAAFYADAR